MAAKAFLDEDFLLSNETARKLYHDCAKELPIIDYHCHLDPQEIWEDRHFDSITQVWLGGDHYKWRLMRSMGVEERFITGDAPDREKFQKWAECLSLAIGSPLYHWSHLELKNYFGFTGHLDGDSAEEVWELTGEKLADSDFSARNLILRSHVEALCTTDDPADSLEWHEKLQGTDFGTKVCPAFRPDKAMNIRDEGFLDYLARLGSPSTFAALTEALEKSMDRFHAMGCRISDHGMDRIPYAPAPEAEIEAIFHRRLGGRIPTPEEEEQYKYALLLSLGRAYHARGWAMQLHYGVIRNNSSRVFAALGADCGIDSIGDAAPVTALASFLDSLDRTDQLPKTILYSLNPNDNAAIETVMGCFQGAGAFGKLQHGAAWWFNDHRDGMEAHLRSLAAEGALATSVGMLTDSRSFLSYARHEYFRRILCNLIGTWVENGEFPSEEKVLRRIVEGICYQNAKEYFGL